MTIDYFSSASAMLEALGKKEISAAELAKMHISRIESVDPDLNAIPVKTFERAEAAAQRYDNGEASGVLAGLPMTLKESTLVQGLPQTAGIPAFQGYIPERDGIVASDLFKAGMGLLGKTNIPVALGDWQANSPVYGTTNNPWDLSRTPGGSTGGGGAALAAGLTPLEVGSDIGGSIRVPAAFCGVYGHRPSETAIPKSGNFPMADRPNPAFLLGVQGPLARTATDLELLFDVMAGADIGERVAWQLHLPPARHDRLSDFRVGVLDAVIDAEPSNAMRGRLDELATLLSKEGASVKAARIPFDLQSYLDDYLCMLTIMTSQGMTREERETRASEMRATGNRRSVAQANGLVMDATEYLMLCNRREAFRAQWEQFFAEFDVVIAPMMLDSAFPHMDGQMSERSLTVDNRVVPYLDNILFPMLAIFAGLPSTAFPAGLDPKGLPLGLQAIGPYLEDRTTLRFVQLLEQCWHRFSPPPNYA